MPKLPMNYNNTIIYKIEHIEDECLVYVGHTTNFDKRKTAHKNNCYNEKDNKFNLKLYQMIRENGGWDMFRMIEVEKYPCNDRREAEKRETDVMKELKASMNTIKSYISIEERKEYIKELYQKNIESIKERKRKHRENNIGEYRVKEKEKNEKIKEMNKERIKCVCGCEVGKIGLKRHQQSKRHIEFIGCNMERLNKVKCECGFYGFKGHLKRHQKSKYHIDIMKKNNFSP